MMKILDYNINFIGINPIGKEYLKDITEDTYLDILEKAPKRKIEIFNTENRMVQIDYYFNKFYVDESLEIKLDETYGEMVATIIFFGSKDYKIVKKLIPKLMFSRHPIVGLCVNSTTRDFDDLIVINTEIIYTESTLRSLLDFFLVTPKTVAFDKEDFNVFFKRGFVYNATSSKGKDFKELVDNAYINTYPQNQTLELMAFVSCNDYTTSNLSYFYKKLDFSHKEVLIDVTYDNNLDHDEALIIEKNLSIRESIKTLKDYVKDTSELVKKMIIYYKNKIIDFEQLEELVDMLGYVLDKNTLEYKFKN